MTTCKSPAHKRYRQAMEGLYIQAALASKDLVRVLDEARAAAPHNPELELVLKRHKLDEVAERLAFGESELIEAEREVNRHFDRGCRNVPPVPA